MQLYFVPFKIDKNNNFFSFFFILILKTVKEDFFVKVIHQNFGSVRKFKSIDNYYFYLKDFFYAGKINIS